MKDTLSLEIRPLSYNFTIMFLSHIKRESAFGVTENFNNKNRFPMKKKRGKT